MRPLRYALLASSGRLTPFLRLAVNNEWRPSSTGETYESFDPSTGKKVLNFAHASEKDVDDAVKAARKAFQTTWGKNIAGADRAISTPRLLACPSNCTPRSHFLSCLCIVINCFADLIERDAAHLAALESFDAGKGVKIALDSDVGDTISCLRFFAGLADKIHGQTIDCFGNEKMVYTLHEPIGVCGQIIPWVRPIAACECPSTLGVLTSARSSRAQNYPMLMWAWKVAPALAAGCCVVMKPSELSSLTALALCELAVEAGIPPGVINTVTGLGATTGNAIARYDRKLSSHGSDRRLISTSDMPATWTSTRSPSPAVSSPAGASQSPPPTRISRR